MARLTSTQQQSNLGQHSTLNRKVHLPFSNQPSYFPPQPASSMSSSTSLSTFDLQPQNIMRFSRYHHPLSSIRDHTSEHNIHTYCQCCCLKMATIIRYSQQLIRKTIERRQVRFQFNDHINSVHELMKVELLSVGL